jgi:hypothetical protein
MSRCITAICPHGKTAFIEVWPHKAGDLYPWAHTDLHPCDKMPPATAAEAGTACGGCGCDFGSHELDDGPLPPGVMGHEPGRCLACPACDRFVHADAAPIAGAA